MRSKHKNGCSLDRFARLLQQPDGQRGDGRAALVLREQAGVLADVVESLLAVRLGKETFRLQLMRSDEFGVVRVVGEDRQPVTQRRARREFDVSVEVLHDRLFFGRRIFRPVEQIIGMDDLHRLDLLRTGPVHVDLRHLLAVLVRRLSKGFDLAGLHRLLRFQQQIQFLGQTRVGQGRVGGDLGRPAAQVQRGDSAAVELFAWKKKKKKKKDGRRREEWDLGGRRG